LRAASFDSSTAQILAFYDVPYGCLHVLDPDSGETQPQMPADLRPALDLSNLDQIKTTQGESTAPLPVGLFGSEPDHTWCYYYEKAELARQVGDWQTVVDLGNQADSLGLNPFWGSEWLPFIEGYARQGDWQKAESLTLDSLASYPLMASGVCETWSRIDRTANPDPAAQQIIDGILGKANCS
jgi:hypothetical protein